MTVFTELHYRSHFIFLDSGFGLFSLLQPTPLIRCSCKVKSSAPTDILLLSDCLRQTGDEDAMKGQSLLGQQGVSVSLHLLQALGEVAVTDLQLADPVQSRAELRKDGKHLYMVT